MIFIIRVSGFCAERLVMMIDIEIDIWDCCGRGWLGLNAML
jgi:hypothetical protein